MTYLLSRRVTMGLRVRMVSTPSTASHTGSADCSPTASSSDGDPGDVGDVARTVLFGDSVQDVVTSIGAPARIFYKDEDKMKIHSPNAHRKAAALKSDYFYNYFTLGFVSISFKSVPHTDSTKTFPMVFCNLCC